MVTGKAREQVGGNKDREGMREHKGAQDNF